MRRLPMAVVAWVGAMAWRRLPAQGSAARGRQSAACSCAETVFGPSQCGKPRGAIVGDAIAGAPRTHGAAVDAQEGVAGALLAQGDRKGRLPTFAQRPHRTGAGDQRGIVAIDAQGEGGVGLGVLVCRAQPDGVRQCGDAIERGQHGFRRALEQASAAETEQGVAAEQQVTDAVGHMARGMARNGHHLDWRRRRSQFDALAIGDPARGQRDTGVLRGEDDRVVACGQCGDAADVVGMVMGQQQRAQPQARVLQGRFQWRRVTRVHRQGIAGRVGQQPDVIVFKCSNRRQPHRGSPSSARL